MLNLLTRNNTQASREPSTTKQNEREGEEIIVVGRTRRVMCEETENLCVCVCGQIVKYSKEKCTVSYSRANYLPRLHLCVSGICLPVVLDSSTHFPSTFPQTLEEVIAKFEMFTSSLVFSEEVLHWHFTSWCILLVRLMVLC